MILESYVIKMLEEFDLKGEQLKYFYKAFSNLIKLSNDAFVEPIHSDKYFYALNTSGDLRKYLIDDTKEMSIEKQMVKKYLSTLKIFQNKNIKLSGLRNDEFLVNNYTVVDILYVFADYLNSINNGKRYLVRSYIDGICTKKDIFIFETDDDIPIEIKDLQLINALCSNPNNNNAERSNDLLEFSKLRGDNVRMVIENLINDYAKLINI